MSKNIVVFCDGTGQEGGKGADLNTNVYKLFNMLENRTPRQIVFYDPGIGTGWRRITGNVGGAGFSRNLKEAYRFLFDHYEAGDRIFLMGFSRGAATVRSLSGFIHHFGILPRSRPELIEKAFAIYKTRPPISSKLARREMRARKLDQEDSLAKALYYGDFDKEEQLFADYLQAEMDEILETSNVEDLKVASGERYNEFVKKRMEYQCFAKELLAANQGKPPKQFMRTFRLHRKVKAFLAANHTQWAGIEFLGCYDTVAALGLPFPVSNAIVNRIPGLQHKFHDFSLSPSVKHAYHALAIDDMRKIFAPVLWKSGAPERWKPNGETCERQSDDHKCDTPGCEEEQLQTLRQVWFTGMHTDVGGGYRERGLADITLTWMLKQAHEHGLLLYHGAGESIIEDHADVMHDSRGKLMTKILYPALSRQHRWEESKLEKLVVHESVFKRRDSTVINVMEKGEPTSTREKYAPWALPSAPPGHPVETEPWVKFDFRKLLVAQEEKWQAWQRELARRCVSAVTILDPRGPQSR